jgi:hypothetical protein
MLSSVFNNLELAKAALHSHKEACIKINFHPTACPFTMVYAPIRAKHTNIFSQSHAAGSDDSEVLRMVLSHEHHLDLAVCVQEVFTHRGNILEIQDKAGNNMGEHHGEAHERNHLEKFVSQLQVNDERHSCPLIRRRGRSERILPVTGFEVCYVPFYLAAWESTLYQSRTELHAVKMVVTHIYDVKVYRLCHEAYDNKAIQVIAGACHQ